MPPVAIAEGAMIVGSAIQGIAGSNAARAQQGAAHDQLSYEMDTQNKAVEAAKPSFDDLKAIQNQYQMSSNLLNSQIGTLKNQLELYNTASSQAKALMSGQAASALAPIQQQQQQQRQALENKLRSQLGPGYATSSAGAMALANFDMQTQLSTSQVQSQYMNTFMNAASLFGNDINRTYGLAANINESASNMALKNRALNVNALTGSKANYNNTVSTAGAPYAGAMTAGAALSTGGPLLAAGLFGGGESNPMQGATPVNQTYSTRQPTAGEVVG